MFRFFSSLKLAVVVILGIALSLAIGTVLESVYDTRTAQYWLYRSPWLYSLLILLGVNIFCVALSRLPWKKKHIPFLLAHCGILILLAGSWITQRAGLDGSMRITEGESTSAVDLESASFVVWENEKVQTVFIPWLPPRLPFFLEFKPILLDAYKLKIDQFLSHADPLVSFVPSAQGGAALHFRFTAALMGISQEFWLWEGDPEWQRVQAGLVQFSLNSHSSSLKQKVSANLRQLDFSFKKDGMLHYSFGKVSHDHLSGHVIHPPWKGGIEITLLKYLPHAKPFTTYQAAQVQYGNQAPSSAIHVEVEGGEGVWLGLGTRASVKVRGREWEIGYFSKRVILPFAIQLDRFAIEYDPGTQSPASFASRVTILGGEKGNEKKEAEVSMNEPLQWNGYTFYQSSYEDQLPRPVTSIFSVNRDPGRFWKYLGSLLIVLGTILLFLKFFKKKSKMAFCCSLFFFLSQFLSVPALSAEPVTLSPHSNWSFTTMALIPIQSGGRIKSFGSYAREAVFFETGRFQWNRWHPVDLLLSWIAEPTSWQQTEWVQSLRGDRLGLFHAVVSGQAWALVPQPDPRAWHSLLDQEQGDEGEIIRGYFKDLLRFYRAGNAVGFERASFLLKTAVEEAIPGYKRHLKNVIATEEIYAWVRPFWIACFIYGLSFLFSLFNQLRLTRFFFGAAVFLHILGILARCFIAGRPPVTNMYESLIWVCLGIAVFAWVLYYTYRKSALLSVSSLLAAFGLFTSEQAPLILDPSLHPLMPVLRSHFWLTIHVLTITLGYAAFALTLGLSNVTLFYFIRRSSFDLHQKKIMSLNQLTYRAMQLGVVFIAAGTILGGVWADYSWGRFWGWDPKEVWALITLLCYLVILHGRYTEWMDHFGFAAWTTVSFLSVIMAWYGVNFILGVGLHSYGFSTGGTPWVAGFVVVQLLYVFIVSIVFKLTTSPRSKG